MFFVFVNDDAQQHDLRRHLEEITCPALLIDALTQRKEWSMGELAELIQSHLQEGECLNLAFPIANLLLRSNPDVVDLVHLISPSGAQKHVAWLPSSVPQVYTPESWGY